MADTLLGRLQQHVSAQPQKKLFSFIAPGLEGGRIEKSYTYAEFDVETSELAQRLLEAGLKRGDRYVAQIRNVDKVKNKF